MNAFDPNEAVAVIKEGNKWTILQFGVRPGDQN